MKLALIERELFKMAGYILLTFLPLFVFTGATCSNKNHPHNSSNHPQQTPNRGSFSDQSVDNRQQAGWSWSTTGQNTSNEISGTVNGNPAKQNSFEQNYQSVTPSGDPMYPIHEQNQNHRVPVRRSEQNFPPQTVAMSTHNDGRNPASPLQGQYPAIPIPLPTNSKDRPGGSHLNVQQVIPEPSNRYKGCSSLSENPPSNQGGPPSDHCNNSLQHTGQRGPTTTPTRGGPYNTDFRMSEETSPSSQPNLGSIQGGTEPDSNSNRDFDRVPTNQASQTDTSDYNYFAWRLFQNADNNHGVIVSPAILAYQLLLFKEFSHSQTKLELEEALKNAKREQIRNLIEETRASPTTKLELANGVFYDNSLRINQHFQNADKNFTHVQQYDANQPTNAIGMINRWAQKVTHNEITQLLDPHFQINRVKMILTTAIFFKGSWKHRFNTAVDGGYFVNYQNEQKHVPFMEIKNNILIDRRYYEVGQKPIYVQVVQLPYDDDTHAMLLLIPTDRKNRISEVRDLFNGTEFVNIVASISQNAAQRVTLKMPKFSINSEIAPIAALQNMGIKRLFTDRAELQIADPPQRVGDIIQRSILRVDEIGTTAASVAASFLIPLSADSVVNREIIFDRPFLSIIYNTKNNAALFISHITDL